MAKLSGLLILVFSYLLVGCNEEPEYLPPVLPPVFEVLTEASPTIGGTVSSGGNYTNHYKNQFVATIQSGQPDSLVGKNLLSGIKKDFPFESGGSLYRVSPLQEKTEIILHGVVEGYAPEPVAWTFLRADGGKSFYTSLGHVDDFHGPVLPRLLANAIEWCLHE